MQQSHIHRVLVTSDDRLVGVVSTSDLLGFVTE
jgi:CBS domain-containing protein